MPSNPAITRVAVFRSHESRMLPVVGVLALVAAGVMGCAQQPGSGGPAIAAPAPDFGACSNARQAFYRASQDAVSNERSRQSMEQLSSVANSSIGQSLLGALGSRVPGGGNIASGLASTLRNLSERANEDTGLIDQFAFSFNGLTQCRQGEVAALRRDLRARRTTRAEATERAAEIRSQALADAAVARDVNAQLSARTRRYQAAIYDVDTQLGAEPAYSPRRTEVAKVRQTVQTNEKALVTQSVAVESSVRERAFDVMSSLPLPRDVQPA